MRVAIKFAYDGTSFHGYQRQPDVPTVEDEIIRSLEKATIIGNVTESRFRSGSRTDRGVSALGNVLAFDTDFDSSDLIPAHNAYAKDVWFHSIAEVQEDFDPRIARGRWYRYHLRKRDDISRLEEVAGVFVGEHDFASFTKDKTNTTRRVDSIDVGQEGDFTVIDVRGQGFLWQMVRRIVDAMERFERGNVELDLIRAALRGGDASLGVAPPEPLFLMDVEYDLAFQLKREMLEGVRTTLEGSLFLASLRRMFFHRLADLSDI
jgi:tRNA pseudouridine38-40 synthase